jgi:hypothetical protein
MSFEWEIQRVDSDASLTTAIASFKQQIADIKELFGECVLGIKAGLGTPRASGYMGGRLSQCSASFLNMPGVCSLGRHGHFPTRLCMQCSQSMREYTALCVND